MITSVFAPFFYCLALNSFNGRDFGSTGKNLTVAEWQHQICTCGLNQLSHLVGHGVGICLITRLLLWLWQKDVFCEVK